MNPWTDVPTLASAHASLEPLAQVHVPALQAAVADGELWRLWYTSVPAPDAVAGWVDVAIADRAAGTALPFAVRDAGGTVVGSTRFGHLAPAHRRAEIGWTWYAARVQRTALNTAVKQLLLAHAFEAMGCIGVQFLTHRMNLRSRAAIARLGAREDGVLRNHMLDAAGERRDSVVFSIIDSEWPMVKRHLAHRLQQGGDAHA